MSVGDRIAYGDKRGTIKFVGKVSPFVGTWFGVDWDSPTDGKHDGTYKGSRYFYASHPKSGSFVKSSEADFGYSFVGALKDQYDYDVISAKQDYVDSMKDFPVSVFDFVNLDKVKQLQGPLNAMQIINLSSYNVNGPGIPNEILETCPNVVDLDLSNNLMTKWESIATIVDQLKHLKTLTLNDTRLAFPENPEKYEDVFANLKDLFMCRCLYTWNDILEAAIMWPTLETLKVPFNKIETLQEPKNVFQKLKNLDIQGNNICTWNEINKLGRLPHLELLNICEIGISEISIPRDEHLFEKLLTLYVSENNIKDFSSMTDLNFVPKLRDLRISKNPLTSDKFLSYREKIIARIKSLKILNGREISVDDRRSAEFEYLTEVSKHWSQCQNDEKLKANFIRLHPRFDCLVKKYGPVEIVPEIDPSLKGHLISVYLAYLDEEGTKTIRKRVHLSLAVHKLITIAKRAFNIKAERLYIVRVSSKNTAIKVELSDQLKALNNYAVEDGDTIVIKPLCDFSH